MSGFASAIALAILAPSLALVAYTYVGYPLLVALLARWRPRPVQCNHWEPRVSVCVCVHNGLAGLPAKIGDVLAHDYPADRLQLVIIDDGSTDGSGQWLQQLPARVRSKVKVRTVARRRGKSACIADAVATADHEVLVFTDLRQRFQPGSIHELCAALSSGGFRLVGGTLGFRDAGGYARSLEAYRRFETWLRENEARSGSVVGVSGALYAVRRSDMPVPPPGLILDDVWVPMRVARLGGRIGIVPEAIAWDTPCATPAREAARKRRTLAGNWQLLALWPGLLLPWRNPIWWRFTSHKVARLLVPFALVAALVSNLLLLGVHPILDGLLAAQCAAYCLAIAGLVWPRLRRVMPIRLAATFLEMNVYAALGLMDYLRARQIHLWAADGSAPDGPTAQVRR